MLTDGSSENITAFPANGLTSIETRDFFGGTVECHDFPIKVNREYAVFDAFKDDSVIVQDMVHGPSRVACVYTQFIPLLLLRQ